MVRRSTLSHRDLRPRGLGFVSACVIAVFSISATASAQVLPEIRTSATNRVPACVTPARLMSYLRERNDRLSPRLETIAQLYKMHGEANRIRWDYAFFQMILETNYLKFKNNSGQGDVDPKQNNFAGIGTTGGGVPGDQFPDASAGVLAQMQHLTAYSGERVENPIGRRTREKQDDIIAQSKQLGRPVTFKDLTRRWAVDRRYGASIEFVASRFRATYCNGRNVDPDESDRSPAIVADARPAATTRGKNSRASTNDGDQRARVYQAAASPNDQEVARAGNGGIPTLLAPPRIVERPKTCKVFTASYGGEKNVLIRAMVDSEMHYTALQVMDGQERNLASSFIRSHARGGEAVAEYPTREAALMKAFEFCPSAVGTLR
jgi:hypothetical protein